VAESQSKTSKPAEGQAERGTDRPAAAAPVVAQPATPVTVADPVVLDAPSAKYSTHPGDVSANPDTGKPFEPLGGDRLKGQHGMEVVDQPGNVVQGVDPDRIPAELSPGVSPDAGGDKLLAAAQAKAPSLTKEFVEAFDLDDSQVAMIARGEEPPPPAVGPVHTNDLYLTPGGWQLTPPGVPPSDVGANQIHREA
jgi:hypothetical protein